MQIKRLEVGSLDTNCYILRAGGETAVVDPGAGNGGVFYHLTDEEGVTGGVKFVLATHFHWDHVEGIPELLEKFDSEFYLGAADLELFRQSADSNHLPDRTLAEGDTVELGGSELEVWETPGHSPGSITLVDRQERSLLVGDLLFSAGFGRTDLPGGSKAELEKSLSRVVSLEGNWKVFPGHGPVFDLEDRVASSPYLADLKES